jgi:hypothetical protein
MKFLIIDSDDELDMGDPTQRAEASTFRECGERNARQVVGLALSALSRGWERDWKNEKDGTLYRAVEHYGSVGMPLPQWLQQAITGVVVTGSLQDLMPSGGERARRLWEEEVVARLAIRKPNRKIDNSFYSEIATEAAAEYHLNLTPRTVQDRYNSDSRRRYEGAAAKALAYIIRR